MRFFLLVCAAVLLLSCTNEPPPGATLKTAGLTGPAVARQAPEWMKWYFFVPQRSAPEPQFVGEEIRFSVNRGQCSDHRDASGASDCARRITRSVIAKNKVFGPNLDFTVGHRYLITFEYWVDPNYRTTGVPLSVARFYGSLYPVNPIFDLKMHPKRGVTFLGRTCVPPQELGGWHRFSVRMGLASDESGFLEVRCDGSQRIGTPILARSNVVTTAPWSCVVNPRCNPRRAPVPKTFSLEAGIIADPVGGRFAPISKGGLQLKIRRITAKRLFVIIGLVDEA